MKSSILFSLFVGLVVGNMIAERAVAQSYADRILADNPFAYYRFDESGGTQATDSSGNERHGTYMGGVDLGQTSATEQLGSAMLLDGESGFVQLGPLNFEADAFTIEAWINLESLDDSCCTSIYSPDGWEPGWVHYNLKGDSNIEFALNSGGPNNHNTNPETVPFGEWVHIASTYDRNEAVLRSYLNGEEIDVNPPDFNTPQAVTLTAPSQIGAWAGSRFFGGLIDEFAIYDTALSPERIRSRLAGSTTSDLDGNGTIDLADFQVLIGNFNTVGTPADGDLNLNGLVDLADFLRFRSDFEAQGAVAAAVPEPRAALLGQLMVLAILTAARRRQN